MCWNQYVSINTFVFGIFGLLLIYFNNTYSTYKLEFFKNPYAYFFVLSVIVMQFIEFLLWRNLDNSKINHILSIIGSLVIYIQPIASLMLLTNLQLRNNLLLTYSIPVSLFALYNLSTTTPHTVKSSSGHLAWKWGFYENKISSALFNIYYLFFLFFSFIYNKYYEPLIFIFLYLIFLHYFSKEGSAGSVWCLSANIMILYFLLFILVVMPLKEIIHFHL